MSLILNQCTKPNHDDEYLIFVCIDKQCTQRGLLCTNCLQDHPQHKLISTTKFLKEYQAQQDQQPKEASPQKLREIESHLEVIRSTAEKAQSIIENSFQSLLEAIELYAFIQSSSKQTLRTLKPDRSVFDVLANFQNSENQYGDVEILLKNIESFQAANQPFKLKQTQGFDNLEQRIKQSDTHAKQYQSYCNTLIDNTMQCNERLLKSVESLFLEGGNQLLPMKENLNKLAELHSSTKHTVIVPTTEVYEVISDNESKSFVPKKQTEEAKQKVKSAQKPIQEPQLQFQETKTKPKSLPVKSNDLLTPQFVGPTASTPSSKNPIADLMNMQVPTKQSKADISFSQVFADNNVNIVANNTQAEVNNEPETELNLVKAECKSIVSMAIIKFVFFDEERILIVADKIVGQLPCLIIYNHILKIKEKIHPVETPIIDLFYSQTSQSLIYLTKSGYFIWGKVTGKGDSAKIEASNRLQIDKIGALFLQVNDKDKQAYVIGQEKVIKSFSTKQGRDITNFLPVTEVPTTMLVIQESLFSELDNCLNYPQLILVGGAKSLSVFDRTNSKKKQRVIDMDQEVIKLFCGKNDDQQFQIIAIMKSKICLINPDNLEKFKTFSTDLEPISCAGYIVQWHMIIVGAVKHQQSINIFEAQQQQLLINLDENDSTCIEVQALKMSTKQVAITNTHGDLVIYTIDQ